MNHWFPKMSPSKIEDHMYNFTIKGKLKDPVTKLPLYGECLK